ncbi:MAG TPA: cation:proton antiporter [Candidatus Dormibacteraeota bacterium]|nr:cation:proton antiporter [Candidatus Dormibacteraeota bacterium]
MAYALAAGRLNRLSIGPALVFVVVGALAQVALPDRLPELEAEAVRLLAEVTLALVLFTDASTLDLRGLRQEAGLVLRLLAVGTLLSIAAGSLLAAALFPELPIGVLLLLGASLAPTDAALGQAVVADSRVPVRIRQLLNAESGLNDGLATPFVVLAVALIGSEGAGHADWLVSAVREGLVGAVAGVVVGVLGGTLLVAAERAAWTSRPSRQLAVLALALGAYLGSIALGGNGFIAAFVAGLAFGTSSRHREEGAEVFSEAAGSLLSIVVWIAAGAAFVTFIGAAPDARPILYALLSLTAVRMVPVALALLGSGLRRDTVLFVGWFGPRGLASIVFAILGLEAMRASLLPTEVVAATVAWTILLSVVLHGLSAGPLAAWYGRRVADHGALAELEGRPEPAPKARLLWVPTDPRR